MAAQNIIRRSGLRAKTGLGLSAIYELIRRNEFPRPIPLSRQAVGWLESDIEAWQQKRLAERIERPTP
jgi:prophage regulatory protein